MPIFVNSPPELVTIATSLAVVTTHMSNSPEN